jgi:hypothetical protein
MRPFECGGLPPPLSALKAGASSPHSKVGGIDGLHLRNIKTGASGWYDGDQCCSDKSWRPAAVPTGSYQYIRSIDPSDCPDCGLRKTWE